MPRRRAHVPSFPIARPGGIACVAAARASAVLSRVRNRRPECHGARATVRPHACASRTRIGTTARGSVAAVRHARARLQLGDRRPDDDALSRRDGCRGDQGRGARSRRSRSRFGTAHRAWPGETRHRAGPETPGGGRHRACAGREIRCPDRELRDRRDGPAGPRRRSVARDQSRPGVTFRHRGSGAPGRKRTPSRTARCCNVMPGSPGSIAIRMCRRASGSRGWTRCAG